MLRSVRELQRFGVLASDGMIGAVVQFYFDDERWAVRYLVVDTGKWLPGRRVLISPMLVGQPDWTDQTMHVALTREQVKNSPDIDTHKPVSRQQELAHHRYYGLPPYWTGPALWGAAPYAMAMTAREAAALDQYVAEEQSRAVAQGDDHLRSTREVIGYTLHASDGELGNVDDFLVEDDSWAIRYLAVNTSQWWFGRKVLIPPAWITSIEWSVQTVRTDVTRQQVRSAPPYDQAAHIDRQWEADYYRHYGMPPYWDRHIPVPPQ